MIRKQASSGTSLLLATRYSRRQQAHRFVRLGIAYDNCHVIYWSYCGLGITRMFVD